MLNWLIRYLGFFQSITEIHEENKEQTLQVVTPGNSVTLMPTTEGSEIVRPEGVRRNPCYSLTL